MQRSHRLHVHFARRFRHRYRRVVFGYLCRGGGGCDGYDRCRYASLRYVHASRLGGYFRQALHRFCHIDLCRFTIFVIEIQHDIAAGNGLRRLDWAALWATFVATATATATATAATRTRRFRGLIFGCGVRDRIGANYDCCRRSITQWVDGCASVWLQLRRRRRRSGGASITLGRHCCGGPAWRRWGGAFGTGELAIASLCVAFAAAGPARFLRALSVATCRRGLAANAATRL